jgi:hypothetical protein
MFNRLIAAGVVVAAMVIASMVQAAPVAKVAGPASVPIPSVEGQIVKVQGWRWDRRYGQRGRRSFRRGWRYPYWRAPRLNRCGVVYNRCYALYGRGSRAYF